MQHVDHFTDKARVWEEVKAQGFPVCIALETAFYFKNFESGGNFGDGGPFSTGSDGAAVLNLPVVSAEDTLSGFDPDDTGR